MANEYMLSHADLVRAVIIHQNIHEGFWCLNINFNITATHGAQSPDPYVALSITSVGIVQAEPGNPMALNAEEVNPFKAAPPPAPKPEPEPAPAPENTANNAPPRAPMQFSRDAYRSVEVHFDEPARRLDPLNGQPPRK